MRNKLFEFPNKALRAQAIKEYMQKYGFDKAICFSCGNASRALKEIGVDTLDISASGDMLALKWFKIGEIKKAFPNYFDATSGHLPLDCMQMVAETFKAYLGEIPDEITLPTGSGETLVCLKLAYPKTKINAVYNLSSATQYDNDAPLNKVVELLAESVTKKEKENG